MDTRLPQPSTLEATTAAPVLPATVLVVDDNAEIRTVVRGLLGRSPAFDVVGEAVDGLEAVEVAANLQPDVVLLDLMMPRSSGDEALPRIREVSPRSMVVVFSSAVTLERAMRLEAEGAFACFEKTAIRSLGELVEGSYRRFRASQARNN